MSQVRVLILKWVGKYVAHREHLKKFENARVTPINNKNQRVTNKDNLLAPFGRLSVCCTLSWDCKQQRMTVLLTMASSEESTVRCSICLQVYLRSFRCVVYPDSGRIGRRTKKVLKSVEISRWWVNIRHDGRCGQKSQIFNYVKMRKQGYLFEITKKAPI